MKKYGWFMKIILSSKLPHNYEREKDPDGNVVYHNTLTNEVLVNHPLEMLFRRNFAMVICFII
jgi:hypothetical protein